VADRTGAFVLETSDRHWAVRHVEDVGSVSNHLTIGDDWDALSDGAIEHAIAQGWWNEASDDRFSFAGAYRESSVVPDVISSRRHQRTCHLLEQGKGALSVDALKRALRDHYGQATPASDLTPDNPHHFSVCMHAEPVGTTTASMIARIPPDRGEPLTYWASLGSPCIGTFVPLYVDCQLPAPFANGGERASDASLWWQFKRLLTAVEQDWQRRGPTARHAFDDFEAAIAEQMRVAQLSSKSVGERTAFMHATCAELRMRLQRIIADVSTERT
jgi:dipeptidase